MNFPKFLLVLAILLPGCIERSTNVSLNIVPQETVLSIAKANGHSGIDRRNGNPLVGYTIWDGKGNCVIFVVPMEDIGEDTWNWVLGDEFRHCFYGHYHE